MSKFKVGDRVFLTPKCVDWEVPPKAIGKIGTVRGITHEDRGKGDPSIYLIILDELVHGSSSWLVHDDGLCLGGPFEEEQAPTPQPKYPQYQMHLVDMLGDTIYSEKCSEVPTEGYAVDKIKEEVSEDDDKILVVIYKPHKVFLVERTTSVTPINGTR